MPGPSCARRADRTSLSGPDVLAPRVLVTRPLPQGKRTAEKLRAMGYQPVLAPMLRIEPLTPDALPDFEAVQAGLVTSVNGLDRLAALTSIRSICLMTVGDVTARAAEKTGFSSVRSASGDGQALMDLVREHLKPDAGPVIHIRGLSAAVEFGSLIKLGFQFEEIIAYEAVETAVLPEAALSPAFPSAILTYSARSASALCKAMRDAGVDMNRLTVIGISTAALQPLSATGARLKIAASPNEAALLGALAEIVPTEVKN